MVDRPQVDEVLMHIAFCWSALSTCERQQNGAVFALDGRTLSSGYNGAPTGMPHCADVLTCTPAGCQNSVHAEANAVAWAARVGVSLRGSTLYATRTPCLTCAQLIVNTGTVRVVAFENYRLPDGADLLHQAGIELEVLHGE